MKRVLFMIIVGICTINAIAQTCKIDGRVVDENKIAKEFVNIVAIQDSVFVSGGITDEQGFFSLNVDKATNIIKVSYLGYETIERKIDASVDSVNMGVISLCPITNLLGEVTVQAQFIQREADRIIMNVGGSIVAIGKNTKELLRIAPGVWTTDNSISIYGKSGTRIYVNDRELNLPPKQLMAYLESLDASAIARVEIIANGGAEYSADSTGGIIKIVLKKTRNDGMVGNVGTSVTGGAKKLWVNPNFNISYHYNSLTINLVGSLNGSPFDKGTTYENSINGLANSSIDGESHFKQKVIQSNIMAGAFYDINKYNTIGLEVEYLSGRNSINTASSSHTISEINKITTIGNYDVDDNNDNLNVRLNYTSQIDTIGSTIKFISNYNHQRLSVIEDNSMTWISEDISAKTDSIYKTNNLSRYNTFTSELKLDKILSKYWRLGSGVKYTRNNVYNNSMPEYLLQSAWVSNTGYDYSAEYNENIVGIYVTANAVYGRWRIKGGLRGEYFSTISSTSSTSYVDFFPNANVSYALTQREKDNYSVSIGYYRNIRRPSFWALSPICRQVSDYSYTVGNPDLKPSYSNSVSLDFILADKFTVATGYSTVSDVILQKFIVDPAHPENMYLTYENDGKDNSFFIHGSGRQPLTKWLSLYGSATYVLNSKKDKSETSYTDYSYVQLFGSAMFSLPYEFYLNLDFSYQSQVQIGNITVYPTLSINPSLRKTFAKNKWALSFSVENLLQSDYKIRAVSAGYDRLRIMKSYSAFTLSVTYNFNVGKNFRAKRMESNIDRSRLIKD